MRNFTFFLCLSLIGFFGCSQNETKKNKTETGTTTDPTTTAITASASAPAAKHIESGAEGLTISGYPYKFHISTNGVKPKIGDEVRYHEIVFKNDSLVQSSYYKFEPVWAVIPPLSQIPSPPPPNYEAVMMMSPGDSVTVWHDLSVAKTDSLPKWLESKDKLRYEIRMVSHRPKKDIETGILATKAREISVGDSLRVRTAAFQAGKLKNEIVETESGLKYIIHEEGSGEEVKEGNFLQVHYMGILQKSGMSFNNTFAQARPFPFQVARGRVIKAWDEALLKIKKGGKITIFVPYQLGYGEAGRPGKPGEPAYIPEKADLAFYVELINIR